MPRRFLAGAVVSALAALTPSASVGLATSDVERPVYATGAITLTVPNGGIGWLTGPILNANTLSGTVILAVPSGATLDGVTNGTTSLYPFQKARIIQTGATAYITDQSAADLSPIVAQANITTGVAAAEFSLPAGYSRFRVSITGIVPSATSDLGVRFGAAGSGSAKAGANDYYYERHVANSAGANAEQHPASAISYGQLLANMQASPGFGHIAEFVLTPGSAGLRAVLKGSGAYIDSTPNRSINYYEIDYTNATSGALGRINDLQVFFSNGTGTLDITIWGEK